MFATVRYGAVRFRYLITDCPYRIPGTVHIITPPWVDVPWSISPQQLEKCRYHTVPQRSALQASSRELSEDGSFGLGTFLVAEQSGLENCRRGVSYSDIYVQVW